MDIVKEPYRKGKREGKSSIMSLRVKQSTIEKVTVLADDLNLKKSDIVEAGIELFLTYLDSKDKKTISRETLKKAIHKGINE